MNTDTLTVQPLPISRTAFLVAALLSVALGASIGIHYSLDGAHVPAAVMGLGSLLSLAAIMGLGWVRVIRRGVLPS